MAILLHIDKLDVDACCGTFLPLADGKGWVGGRMLSALSDDQLAEVVRVAELIADRIGRSVALRFYYSPDGSGFRFGQSEVTYPWGDA